MESDAKLKKQSSLARLFEYAGNYKYLTILSWIFSVVSAWIALVPFYYIWKVIKEVFRGGKCRKYCRLWMACSRICNFIDGALHLRADVFPFVSISCAGEYPFTVDAPYYDTADGIYGQ